MVLVGTRSWHNDSVAWLFPNAEAANTLSSSIAKLTSFSAPDLAELHSRNRESTCRRVLISSRCFPSRFMTVFWFRFKGQPFGIRIVRQNCSGFVCVERKALSSICSRRRGGTLLHKSTLSWKIAATVSSTAGICARWEDMIEREANKRAWLRGLVLQKSLKKT